MPRLIFGSWLVILVLFVGCNIPQTASLSTNDATATEQAIQQQVATAVEGTAIAKKTSLPISTITAMPTEYSIPTITEIVAIRTPEPERTSVSATSESQTGGSLPPSVYVLDIRLDPPNPKEKQNVWFHVTFLNTTSNQKRLRWFVYVFRADHEKPFGQTSTNERNDNQDLIPVGQSERQSLNTWQVVSGDGYCRTYWVTPFWLDLTNSKTHEIYYPIGQRYKKTFTVCPS